jgi:DNA-binding transcriptional MerR regulator
MGEYSIKELERLSGIKAHTIRIWEKRYQIISPLRTSTNIRYYSDEDLKKIINVSLLNTNGIKISKIAGMSAEEISTKILDLSETKPEAEIYIDQLVVSMVDMKEEAFEEVLFKLTKKLGFERGVIEVVYPFLEKIGVLWQTGAVTPAHEHFISNLIRQKIITAIDGLPFPPEKSKTAILFLAEGELHEIGLLFYNYLTRKNGIKTFYLGQSVPYGDLKTVCGIHQPDILITSLISSPSPRSVENYIQTLSKDFPDKLIFASGLLLSKTAFRLPKNVKLFYRATELTPLLKGV